MFGNNNSIEKNGEQYVKISKGVFWIAVTLLFFVLLALIIWMTNELIQDKPAKGFIITSEILISLIFLAHFIKKRFTKDPRKEDGLDMTQIEAELSKATSKLEYLSKRVDFSYQQFKGSTSWTYRNVRFYKYSLTVLSGLATVVLGLSYGFITDPKISNAYSILSKDIALVLNTLMAALTSLAVFWNMEKYWMQNKVIKQQLKILKYEIDFELKNAPSGKEDKLARRFLKKYLQILKDFHLYWEGALTNGGE